MVLHFPLLARPLTKTDAGLAAARPPDEPAPLVTDAEIERILEETRHGGHEVERGRQIFVNRNLRLDQIELIGFDMDYTLAIYHLRRIEALSYEMTVGRLIAKKGYPESLRALKYDHDFVIRGLVVDKQRGNLFKVDRHNHVGRCYHGRRALTDDERRAIYRNEKISLRPPRYAVIDTLFSLPEACLYVDVIELFEREGREVDFVRLYDDIRESIDEVHRDNSLKTELKKDLGHYIVRDPELGPALHKLRSGGKKTFLLTNSLWDYTDAVMKYLFDGLLPEYPSWRNYFDYVIVGAQKPGFFSEKHPLVELDAAGEPVGEARGLERGRVYQGGNLGDLEHFAGIGGERVLYVGDHIYGDIIRNRKVSLWRTCMVVQELETEIAYTEGNAGALTRLRELERLRAKLDDELNHHKLILNQLDRRSDKAKAAPADPTEDDASDGRSVPAGGGGEVPHPIDAERRREKACLEKLRRALRSVVAEAEAIEAGFERGSNASWGLVFKEGNENSRFGDQVEDYACLYTSRASNFLHYSPMQYFRSPRDVMPHEP